MLPLAPSDREALALRWVELRAAAQKAEAASAAWNNLNDALMSKWRAEKLDDLAISRVKPHVLALNDLYGQYTFFANEVVWRSADIQAELAYRQLLAMGEDEPAPSWPAAADRSVPRPSYRPRPYAVDDDDAWGGLVEPGPLTDPALRGTDSPTGPSPSGLPHVSGPVGGQWSTPPGVAVVDHGAAGTGVPAAPTTASEGCPRCGHESAHLFASGCVAKLGGELGIGICGCKHIAGGAR